MTREELHAALDDEGAGAPPDLDDDERWLLRHVGAGIALLRAHAALYGDALARRQAEPSSDELDAAALDAAATIGLLLQSARRRPRVLIAASGTAMSPTLVLGALDQLFFSFILLTAPLADERSEAMLTREELDELLAHPELEAWGRRLAPEGGG